MSIYFFKPCNSFYLFMYMICLATHVTQVTLSVQSLKKLTCSIQPQLPRLNNSPTQNPSCVLVCSWPLNDGLPALYLKIQQSYDFPRKLILKSAFHLNWHHATYTLLTIVMLTRQPVPVLCSEILLNISKPKQMPTKDYFNLGNRTLHNIKSELYGRRKDCEITSY